MQLTRITTDDSLMELVSHGTEDFPFQYYQEDIRQFNFGTSPREQRDHFLTGHRDECVIK